MSILNSKYVTNASWLIFERIFQFFTVFIVGVYVARYLGPTQYGILNYCLSFVALFTSISTLGLESVVIKYLVRNRQLSYEILGTSFVLRIIGFLISLLLFLVFSSFTSNTENENTYFFIIIIANVFQVATVLDWNNQSKIQSKYSTFARVYQTIISTLIKIILICFKAPILFFVLNYLLDSLVLALLLFYFSSKTSLIISNLKVKISIAKVLLKHSWPLIFSSLSIMVYMKIDQVMLNNIVDSNSVGLYSVAVRLAESWYFIPMAIISTMYPKIIELNKSNIYLYRQSLKKIYNLMIITSLVVAIVTTFMSSYIIQILYGINYLESAKILNVYIWAGVFITIGMVNFQTLIANGKQKQTLYRTILGAILNVILNIPLIKKYGSIGSAYATVISQFFTSFFLIPFFKGGKDDLLLIIRSILTFK